MSAEDITEDFDTEIDAADLDGETAAPLAAPGRAAGAKKSSGGSRKTVLAGLLVLVATGMAGGYYYIVGAASEIAAVQPPPVIAQPVIPAETAVETSPALAEMTLPSEIETEAVTTIVDADMTPPETIPSDTLATEAVSDTIPETMPTEDTAATEESAPLVLPVTDESEAEAPELLPVQTQVVTTPGIAEAEADLPEPGEAVPPVMPETAAATETKQAPMPLRSDSAEQALVDNAPILETMTASNAAAAAEADKAAIDAAARIAERAIVRPLPEKYLIVQHDKAAGDLGARLTAARNALAEGRHQAALALFNDLSKTYPNDSRIMMGRAIALQSLGQHAAALSSYESVLIKEPKNLEALTNMLGLIKGQDPAFALSKLQELHATYPANADIAAQLGVSSGVSGDYPAALKYLDMAEALQPGSSFVTYNKAVVYDRMGNGIQASALYREILARHSAGTLDSHLPLDAIRARLAVIR